MELCGHYDSNNLRLDRHPSNNDHGPRWGPLPQSFAGDSQLPLRCQHFVFDPALLQHPGAEFSCRSSATGFVPHVR